MFPLDHDREHAQAIQRWAEATLSILQPLQKYQNAGTFIAQQNLATREAKRKRYETERKQPMQSKYTEFTLKFRPVDV